MPRLTTKLSAYQDRQRELALDKKTNSIIDARIRALQKAKNKARFLPSKDAPPAKKRRTEQGISIRQVWGKLEISKSENMTRQEYKEQEKKTPEKEYKRKVLKRDKNGIEIRTDGVVSAPEKDREKYEKLD